MAKFYIFFRQLFPRRHQTQCDLKTTWTLDLKVNSNTLRNPLCSFLFLHYVQIHLIPTPTRPSLSDKCCGHSLCAGSQPASSSLPTDLVWHSGTSVVSWAAALLCSSPGADSEGSSKNITKTVLKIQLAFGPSSAKQRDTGLILTAIAVKFVVCLKLIGVLLSSTRIRP